MDRTTKPSQYGEDWHSGAAYLSPSPYTASGTGVAALTWDTFLATATAGSVYHVALRIDGSRN